MKTIYGFFGKRQNFSWGIFTHIWVFVYSFSQLRKKILLYQEFFVYLYNENSIYNPK